MHVWRTFVSSCLHVLLSKQESLSGPLNAAMGKKVGIYLANQQIFVTFAEK